jgi:phage terminase large subunit GpA-like protein
MTATRTTTMPTAEWLRRQPKKWRPPPKLSLSQWADEHFYLSAESAAEPGRWRTIPYQREMMNAITDPTIVRVSVKKSARVGFTKTLNAAIAYHMVQDPCPILVVQPTVEDAEGYSKEEIAPMLRDCPILAGLATDDDKTRAKKRGEVESTILHKRFPGGVLSMVGANSGRGFRRVSRRVVIFDEVDGYPPGGAGKDGDPIKLGEKRSEYYWNRKIVAGSTPLLKGSSRIDELFEAGDQRRYHVPCPHCGHMDILGFDREASRGHTMRWTDPADAHFVCRACAAEIAEDHKLEMIQRGRWIADKPGGTHASFHIWAAYSLSPNASWATIVAEYLEAKKSPTTLRTFVNTVLGESFAERGEAPAWELLYARRESWPARTIPVEPLVVTAGVDVQKDRLMYEVVAWLADKQSYSIEKGEILGDTALDSTWTKLDELAARTFTGPGGNEHAIRMLAVDSGYNAQIVYGWTRGKPRTMAVKGSATATLLVGAASPVDITIGGRKIAHGGKVWTVGVDLAKSELYGWLRITRDGTYAPPGYCHFPQHDEEFFKQLTAEHMVTVVHAKTGRETQVWHAFPNQPNHYLDCRVYARAAAYRAGLDKHRPPAPKTAPPPATDPVSSTRPKRGWLGTRRGSWLK